MASTGKGELGEKMRLGNGSLIASIAALLGRSRAAAQERLETTISSNDGSGASIADASGGDHNQSYERSDHANRHHHRNHHNNNNDHGGNNNGFDS
jgi:hypothetical protein